MCQWIIIGQSIIINYTVRVSVLLEYITITATYKMSVLYGSVSRYVRSISNYCYINHCKIILLNYFVARNLSVKIFILYRYFEDNISVFLISMPIILKL